VLPELQNRITAAKVGDNGNFIQHRYIQRMFFICAIVGIWQLIVELKLYPPYLLPAPIEVLNTLLIGFSKQNYFVAILASLRRIFIGYILAILCGCLAGLAIARYKYINNSIGVSLTSLQSIPSVAWIPLALLWFGISENAVLFIIILEAFIPCALGVKTGVLTIPREIIRAGLTLGAHSIDLYFRVIFPAIVPQLMSSLRLSWAFAWRALIAGELFVSGQGIGQTLEIGRSLADMSQVLAMILVIAILGYFTDNVLFRSIERHTNKLWGLET
jgi:NitT/TauT family transport system permease protein